MPVDLTSSGIQSGDGAPLGIAGSMAHTAGLGATRSPCLMPDLRRQWLAVEGVLVTIEQNHLAPTSDRFEIVQPQHFGSVEHIGTGDMVSGTTKGDVPFTQSPPDSAFTQGLPALRLQKFAVLAQ